MTKFSIDEIVNEKIMLVSPKLSLWQGRHDLKANKTELLVNEERLEENDLTTPSVKLFTKEGPHAPDGCTWQSKLQNVIRLFKEAKNKFTLSYDLGTARILPVAQFTNYVNAIYGVNGSPDFPEPGTPAGYLKYIQDTMPDQYDDLLSYWEAKTYWPYVQDRVPSKERLAKRYRFSITTFNIGVSEGVQKHLMEREMSTVAKACRSQISELVATMIEEPRVALAEAIESASRQILQGERVTANTLSGVRRAIEQFKLFDFLADDVILAKLDGLAATVEAADPKELATNPDVATLFTDAINAIGREMLDSVATTTEAYSLERTDRFIG